MCVCVFVLCLRTLKCLQVRMMRKGVLCNVLPWQDARRGLAMRLHCRMLQQHAAHCLQSADPNISLQDALVQTSKPGSGNHCTCREVHNGSNNEASIGANSLAQTSQMRQRACFVLQHGMNHEEDACHQHAMRVWCEAAQWMRSQSGAQHIAQCVAEAQEARAAREVARALQSRAGLQGVLHALQHISPAGAAAQPDLHSFLDALW